MKEARFLEKAIASPDYRRYIEENKIELSDWDLATLIYNNKKMTQVKDLLNI